MSFLIFDNIIKIANDDVINNKIMDLKNTIEDKYKNHKPITVKNKDKVMDGSSYSILIKGLKELYDKEIPLEKKLDLASDN